jgi:hypothetical protein
MDLQQMRFSTWEVCYGTRRLTRVILTWGRGAKGYQVKAPDVGLRLIQARAKDGPP